MSASHSRRAKPALWKWPVIFALFSLYAVAWSLGWLLSRPIDPLMDAAEWALERAEKLRDGE